MHSVPAQHSKEHTEIHSRNESERRGKVTVNRMPLVILNFDNLWSVGVEKFYGKCCRIVCSTLCTHTTRRVDIARLLEFNKRQQFSHFNYTKENSTNRNLPPPATTHDRRPVTWWMEIDGGGRWPNEITFGIWNAKMRNRRIVGISCETINGNE